MPLATGMHLGRFEVVGPLGAGGMGEVYRARDRELGRDVAIKVLPDAVAADPTRLARFEREARATAALAHPNILVIHDVGSANGVPFVVFELLQGHTLRTLLGRPFGVARALDYGTQIAEGLAAAHDRGVVHRDIKPENLFVTTEGRVKILDFGIASHGGGEPGDGLGMTLTAPGMAVGTAGYMAPEQVRGESVDARADVFALGVVLYEMLAGRRAFPGKTGVESLTAILKEDPPRLEEVARDVPVGVADVVARCLKKPREQRFQSARDVGFALAIAAHPAPPPTRLRAPLRWAVLATIAALALGGAAGARWWPDRAADERTRHVAITMPASARLSVDYYVPFAISHDGSLLAYTTSQPERIMLRRLGDFDPTPISGTEGAFDPFFSPDDRWIGFWTFGHIKKIPVGGGPPVEVCEAADMLGASWTEDGSIVFAPGAGHGLSIVSADGGTPRPLSELDPGQNEVDHVFPQALDGGRAVLFTARTRSKDAPFSVDVLDVATKARRRLLTGAQYARYLPIGYLVYVREHTLYAMKVAAGTLVPEGPAVAVLADVHVGVSGEALVSVSGDGTLVYVETQKPDENALVWVTRAGLVSDTGLPVRAYRVPRASPRAPLIAVNIVDGDTTDIWTASTDRGNLERLTFGRRSGFTFSTLVFSPDGARLTYAEDVDRGGAVVTQSVDGTSPKQPVIEWEMPISPSRWLPDGRALLLSERGAASGGNLLVYSPDNDRKVTLLTPETTNQWGASPSADGRYLVYASDETGRFEVFVMAYPGPGLKRQLTTDGGVEPMWGPDGKEIYYRVGNRMMSIPVTTTPALVVGRPSVLFEGSFVAGAAGQPAYDVGPDGRFLMMRAAGGRDPRQLRVVLNWFDELNARLAHDR